MQSNLPWNAVQLPDVNVWLALVFESHKQHTNARECFDQMTSSEVIFCRLTMLGFLSLAQTEAAFVRLHGLTLYTFDAALQNHPLLK